ncbi:MAG: aldehyde oxidoreductase [Planctomycetota bacterium]|nr:MAG: aldehyde oxidoreductase [Planctomycetota bacterium]
MRTLRFSGGQEMPALGLGTWKSKPGEVGQAVKAAIELGYRHFDCAAIYMNEKEIGAAFAECLGQGLVKREDLWVTSKLWNDKHAAADVRPALEQTLADLQLDYLDLYLMHWPLALQKGVLIPRSPESFLPISEIPVESTWAAMESCAEAGLVRHLGVSNFSVHKLASLAASAQHKPELNQVEMHPYLAQPQLVEWCVANSVQLTAYSPLGSPDRPSSMRAEDEPRLFEDPVIVDIAKAHSMHPAQILIAWAVNRGSSVIPKSVNRERMAQNLVAAELELSAEEMQRLNALDRHHRLITGEFWTMPGSPWTLANLWDE